MERFDYYALLRKFPRNILFTIFDFLPTETVFLGLGLINKHFNSKSKDYQKVARTFELKYINYPLSPIFPCIENLVFHMVNTFKQVVVKLPETLINLKFLGNSPPGLMLQNIPNHLQSFKHSSYDIQDYRFNDIYINSLQTRTLKVLKVYKYSDVRVLTYLETSKLTNLEEIYLPLECNLDEATISLLLPNLGLKKISFGHALTERPDCIMNGLYLLCQIKTLRNLTFPGCCLGLGVELGKVIKALPNLEVIKFCMDTAKCNVENHIKLLNSLSGIPLKKICTSVIFSNTSHDFLSFFTTFLSSFPLLEVLKMYIHGILITGFASEVIRICKEHPSLYKFNGLPIKLLEDSKETSITLYEDLLKSRSINRNNGNLSMEIFYNYSHSLVNLREFKIKPIRSAAILIYINRITEKIRKIGYFTDMQQYFKIPKWAFTVVLMIIKERHEFRYLKLESIPNNNFFLNILEDCTYLEEYEGPYSADLLKKVNFKSIKLDMCDRTMYNIEIFNLLLSQHVEKFTLRKAYFENPIGERKFSLTPNLIELKLLQIKGKPEFIISLVESIKKNSLKTFCLDFSFLSHDDMNSFIPALQYLTTIEVLSLNFNNSVFNSSIDEVHIEFIRLLEKNISNCQQLKEFSLYIFPIPPQNHIGLYYSFLKQLCQSHLLLTKLYDVSSQNFDMDYFRSVLI
ncbi:hypothetical protein SteCoe_36206 [Stentor coeruleus]|uniref:F-box domain-containing protein n=1 Tax=Stentor coeruleus TaxID=5963 RepID=A0A1R2AQM4_9CILI|nr:hypothetical protein SteCoe_36206 [Stentor coeruleus]